MIATEGTDDVSKRPFLASNTSESAAVKRRSLLEIADDRSSSPVMPKSWPKSLAASGDRRVPIDQDRMRFLFTMLDNPPKLHTKLTAKLAFL